MNKNKLVDKIDHHFINIAQWSIANRIWVILFCILLLLSGGYYTTKVRFDGSLQGFFAESDPVYTAYKEYLYDFLSDEVTYIMYRAPDKEHGPFDINVMKTIGNLTTALEDEVPFVREATSLTNVEFLFAEGEDELIVDELMLDFPDTQEELLAIKKKVISKPVYVDYLINSTGEYAAIYLEMAKASPDPLEEIIYDPEKGDVLENIYPQVSYHKVVEILERPEFADSGIEFYLTGDVPMNSVYNYMYMGDSSKISLYTLLIIAIISFLLLRTSLVGLLAPMGVVVLSVFMMLGCVGLMGWSVGLFITMAPSLICAIGVAQAVHILQEFHRSKAHHGDRRRAVKEAIKKVGGPCMLAAVTTAAGFLVMGVSELRGLAEFGIYSAIGVIFTFILSITLLVVFLARGKPQSESEMDYGPIPPSDLKGVNPLVGSMVSGSIKLNEKHPKLVLTGFAALFIWAFIGLEKLSVDFNFMDEFKDYVPWKQATIKADKEMGGIMSVTYVIETNREDGAKDVKLLQALDQLQAYAESLPYVKKSFSMADFVKDLNRTFHNDDPAHYSIPDNQELVSQYLLVYEVSGGDQLFEVVTPDFSRTVLEMRVVMTDASNIRDIIDKINAYEAENPLPGAELRESGIGWLWVRIADYIASTQYFAYSLIFVIIALVMCIAYGSIKVGLLSMIPNLTPVVITLGGMGWFGVHLDYMKLLLATIAIGIAVDDTIHLVTRFRSRYLELGDYTEAMKASLKDVGPALVITTMILIGGFGGYQFTDLQVLSTFGILLSSTIGLALLADLLLMPVLLQTLKPFGKEKNWVAPLAAAAGKS
ncbi:MAG: MMPL family transporter [Halieaceae bacterium]|nr:MMPL family transporter [Halieaceae bacterium]